MQELTQALSDVRQMYQKHFGIPAPQIDPTGFMAFPPGVDPLKHAVEEIEALKKLSTQVDASPAPVSWVPRADAFAATDGFVLFLEIPGITREDLKVFVTGAECVIRGERKLIEEKLALRPMNLERPWGKFERRFMLPPGVSSDKVKAKLRDGILELRFTGGQPAENGEKTVEVS